MEEITNLYPMITECAVNVIKAIIAIVFSCLIIPWVKNTALPWLNEKHLCGKIARLVRAAEKLADSGTIDKKAKLDYVIGILVNCGIKVTPEVRAFIENAVGELDDEFANNLAVLADAIVNYEESFTVDTDVTVGDAADDGDKEEDKPAGEAE